MSDPIHEASQAKIHVAKPSGLAMALADLSWKTHLKESTDRIAELERENAKLREEVATLTKLRDLWKQQYHTVNEAADWLRKSRDEMRAKLKKKGIEHAE